MAKKVYFVQVLLTREEATREMVAADVVKLLEAAGCEPAMIKVEQVTGRARFDEIMKMPSGGN